MRFFCQFLLGFCLCFAVGCLGDKKAQEASTGLVSADHSFPFQLGARTIQLELALLPREQQKGLMYRDSMPEDHGMLFVAAEPHQHSFWMKNTTIPLDIGYFAPDGTLREIYRLYPLNTHPVRSISENIQFALEMNWNWFAKHDIKPGTRLDLEALAAAIEKRGLPAIASGLE